MEFFDDTIRQNVSKISKVDIDNQIELISKFFETYSQENEKDFFQSMLVDLYRAITCYRMYDNIDEFMKINPELEECKNDIEELWLEFDKLTPEELSEVALELLKDM